MQQTTRSKKHLLHTVKERASLLFLHSQTLDTFPATGSKREGSQEERRTETEGSSKTRGKEVPHVTNTKWLRQTKNSKGKEKCQAQAKQMEENMKHLKETRSSFQCAGSVRAKAVRAGTVVVSFLQCKE